MSFTNNNSQYFSGIQFEFGLVEESNNQSLLSNENTPAKGLFIAPSPLVPGRDSNITGYILQSDNEYGKLSWANPSIIFNSRNAKETVRLASTTNIVQPVTTIDSVMLNDGDRVLLKDQLNPSENGIYVFSNTMLTRSDDAQAGSVSTGAYTIVREGAANFSTLWVSPEDNSVFGDPITFDLIRAASSTVLPAPLQSIADLTTVANEMLYTTAPDTYDTTELTPFVRNNILNAPNSSTLKVNLGYITSSPTLNTLNSMVKVSGIDEITDTSILIDSFNSLTGINDLTATGNINGVNPTEFAQLANIDTTTISTIQWGYLGDMDQPVSTTSTPTFAGLSASNNLITDVLDPVLNQDAATKAYVDMISGGGPPILNVYLATTSFLSDFPVYSSPSETLTSTTSPGILTIDSITTSVGDRVLIKDQVDNRENGVYDVTDDGSSPGPEWVLTRSSDFNQAVTPITSGTNTFVDIVTGASNSATTWMLQFTVNVIDPLTDPVIWIKTGEGTVYAPGLGIDPVLFSTNIIQVDLSSRLIFTGNEIDLSTVTVPYGGTGQTTLTSNGVLIGNGVAAVTTSKQAPAGDFVGTTDTQTLTNKTITDNTNDVTARALFSDSGANTVSVFASANPTAGQVLTATSATTATWQDSSSPLTAGLGIDPVQLASDIIQLDVTARFTFSGNDLELATVTVPFGGTGQTTLTSNGVLIGNGVAAVTTSKQAPTGDFVGTTDTQTLTNKTITDNTNDITARALFSDSGANTVSVFASANPTAGQVLTATSATTATWQDNISPLTAGLGIDATQLASDIIQLDVTARFTFSGNDLELATVTVPFGGTGQTTLTSNGVLIGNGVAAVTTSKQAPTGDFVGTTDTQTLTNKTITDNTNDVTSRALFSDSGANTVSVFSSANPTAGQVLTAINATTAEWQDNVNSLTAGLGIDATQLASDIIQLDVTARFTFSGNDLELATVTVPFGGTGQTTLTSNGVLIGQGTAAVDTSKAAPTGDFVGTTDTQTLTNKTMTNNTNDITARALFSDSGANTVSVFASPNPIVGQVLTATSATVAEWQSLPTITFTAGLGIDATQLASDIIQLDVTARFTFSGNDLELATVTVPFGGTGQTTLTSNGVLIGQGAAAVDTSKAAPTGDFVGTTDTQTLTDKTMTDNTNDITARALFSDSGANTVSVFASANPTAGQVLTAINATTAEWQDNVNSLTAGLGIDATQLASDIIQLDVTARFTFSGNDLELATVTVPFGGTGQTTLTSNGVLIGQGAAAVDTSKAAPTGDFVGTTDTQTLTNKTMTDNTNDITARALFTNTGTNSVSTFLSPNPTSGQILTATSATTATWQDPAASPLSAGLGIDATQLASDIIQLDITARFTFSGNDLELATVTVPFGGTGQTILTSNGVLIGQGVAAVDTSKAAPTGDFVGTTDTQTLTNKTMTDNTNDITARALFTDSGANTVSTFASANPTAGQVLIATGVSTATWQDFPSLYTAGLGIDATQLASDIIQLDVTARFTFSGNDLELATVTVPFGGTGQTTLTTNGVLIGQGTAAVDTSKAAPTGDFVGTTDSQTLTNKTMTDNTNDITARALFSDSGANTVSVFASANPTAGQVLTAINATTAEWQDNVNSLSAGLGIDATQLASDIIQLETTSRFTFLGNELELATVTVPFGGTGQATLTSNGVLIGNGVSAVTTSKQAPTGDFVGTTDTQTLTNKTITDNTNDITARALFSDSGANTVSVFASANPTAGQVLTATSATTATWQDNVNSLTAGLGIDATQLASDIIQLDVTARFTFSGNDLELATVTVPFGGTGQTTLTSNGVLIGQGAAAVDTSKAAPTGDFVGTTDTQTLTNKTMTDNTNDITARALFSNNGLNTVSVFASANPTAGQVLTATSATVAEWQDNVNSLTAGLGIDATQLASDIIQLDVTARFTFSGNDLELATVTVPFGGTGQTTLTSNGVLIGQGAAAVDTSKAAPTGDFVGTTDTQTLTNKTMTDNTNDITARALFSNNGLNTVSVFASANPTVGQVLTATSSTTATWQDNITSLTAGLGIDPTQLASDIIQLETTARFTFSGNELELATVTVPFGGTGQTTLTSNGVLIGQGAAAVDTSKAAPTGDFVGTTDTQTLTNKTMTDNTNDITARALFSNSGANTVSVFASANPTAGQVLTATSATVAEWQDNITSLTAGLGIDPTQLASDIIQLETTARFTFSGNELELATVTVPFGGTGQTTLTSNGVLIGQGVAAVDTSKAAPTGDFVGTSDTQTLTNKTMTDNTNDITARALFSDSGANTVSVFASANPTAGQVLTATSATVAEWQDSSSPLTAGLGIDATQLASDIIQLETTARFTFSGNDLELATVTVPFGGTGQTTLTSNGVLIGQGAAAVDTSKAAPTGDFVGTTDSQTLTNKTITDNTNDITARAIFSDSGANTVSVFASANPTAGQVLTATSATTATWQDSSSPLTAGLGIDATQLASDIIQLDVTARFTFSGNDLELATVTVPFGGTGQTTLTSNGVLIGQGAAAVDTSKAAPTGDFVGTTDTQTLTNKTITDNTNDITARALFTGSGTNTVSTFSATNPTAGQLLTATSATTAVWADPSGIYSAGLGIDASQLALDIIQLDITSRFVFSGTELELATVTVPFGGTGQTTLTSNGVLIGNGVAAVTTSKQAPTGDFVGTTDTQTLTNKTMTDNTNDVTARALFSDSGANTVSVFASANPTVGQVLTATSATTATWQDSSSPLTAGLGIDATQLASDIIQLDVTARFTFSGNDLELATVTVPFGGTGQTTLTSNGVLIGQGAAAVDTSKAAPTGDFVGTTDSQTLTNKTITDNTNDITARALFSNSGANTVSVFASANPTAGQVLTATSATVAEWQDNVSPLTAGLGIDATQLASDIIQLDVTARFTFSGNDLELSTVLVPFGGTGQTTLTSNGVLIGQGVSAVDTSKQAPTGDFVGTTDIQTLTNKTMTDNTNDITARALFSNSGANTVSVFASANPTAGQVLTATSATTATWQDAAGSFTAGLGIDATQLASDIIQLDVTARFTFSGNDLELATVTVPFGGTGQTTLTSNGVLIGQGVAAVDTSKAAPTGDFVGTSDIQTLTNKTMTDNTNDITARALFSNSGANTVSVFASANPTAGQVLTATSATVAEWQDAAGSFTAGLGIDATQLASDIIQLDVTARFTFSGNDLELATVTVPFGGTGQTTLTSNGVLIGQGAAAVDTSKAAPTGDFVGTTDTQTLTNKTMTDNTNDITARALFSDSGANTVSVFASANPTAGQVLTATSATTATWQDSSSPLTAGLGIDATQLASDIIQLDVTARFTFSGNDLELATVTVPFGGTGQTTLTSNGVLIGQGAAAVDTSKAAPTGDFVGTTDTQTLTNKTITDNTNDITARALFSDSGANTVSVFASANPIAGQVLTATSATVAEWQDSSSPLTAGLGIDATQLASDIIQLDVTARFTFSGNDLELATVTVPFGGTGQTTLTSNGVLIGQGAAAVDTSKAAPTGDFVGTTDTQTLTNKTITDNTNDITARALFSNSGANTVSVFASANPTTGQVLTATSATTATWQDSSSPLTAGLGIDATQLASDVIQLETTARFTFSINALELATVTVPFGGTGQTTLTSNGVLIGQGAAAVDTSKAAPTGDFVGTTDTQTLTNKTMTDNTNNITARALFSNSGANTVSVFASANPTAGQVLTATSATVAEWQDATAGSFTAGLGIDATQLASDIIQLDVTARFTFSGNDLELATVTVPFGGTGQTTLTSNGVLIGQGAAAVDTSKAAPTGDFVGTTDSQTLTNKTMTDNTNDITARALFSNSGANTVSVFASANPTAGQVLTATSATTATWQDNVNSLTAGLGIDATQLASDIVQLDVTARFTFSGNDLELATVTVPFGGTGQTTLTSNGVLIGNGVAAVTTSKQAPTGDFVGTTDTQTLTNKTITDNTNDVTARALFSNSGANTVSVFASANPTVGQVLVATSATTATWQDPTIVFYAYDAVGGPNFTTTPTTLDFQTIVIIDTGYTESGGVVTIANTGLYEVSFTVGSANVNNAGVNRGTCSGQLQIDTGGGFTNVGGTLSSGYMREQTTTNLVSQTMAKTVPINVTVANTQVRVVYFKNSTTTWELLAEASSFYIKRIQAT